MGFADAFLSGRGDRDVEDKIATHVNFLLQAITPEPQVPEAFEKVRSSNFCYGVPMNWALKNADRQATVRRALRDRLVRFEPRLKRIRSIEMTEDEVGNLVDFVICAEIEQEDGAQEIEIETRVSLFDQQIEKASL